MPKSLVDQSNQLLGAATPDGVTRRHPFAGANVLEEVADGVASVNSFANVAAISTDDGLVVIDTGGPLAGTTIRDLLADWDPAPVHTAVYTHGHIDHVMGTAAFDAASDDAGRPRPRVVAHEAVQPRFERYCLTAGYNAAINQRQFQAPGLSWPTDYRAPDDTFVDRIDLRVGEVDVQLHHDRGETDDHTWVWVPDRRLLCTGDLFIWCVPNAGNPQKVQRYARDWAVALRKMAALEPEILLPGHGLPIVGGGNVRAALVDTADLLDSLVDQTLSLMNQGARLDEILHTVRVPEHLTTQAYLQPIYDEPEFIVRNVWRLYGGWYDGIPSHLKPAPERALAEELARLAGGPRVLAERAEALASTGDLRLAGRLIDLAGEAAPDDPGIHRTRAALLFARAEAETSLMAKGIYRAAGHDSARIAESEAT